MNVSERRELIVKLKGKFYHGTQLCVLLPQYEITAVSKHLQNVQITLIRMLPRNLSLSLTLGTTLYDLHIKIKPQP